MQTYIKNILNSQKIYFQNGKTISMQTRINAIDTLQSCIKKYEEQIIEALYKDLGKSKTESYITEIMQIYEEIKVAKKWLKNNAKPKKVKTPLSHFGGKSKIYYNPYGIVLIVSPWNYPFHLSIIPLIGAITAGNCVVLKPSEYSINSSIILDNMLKEAFNSDFVHVFCGDKEIGETLLKEKFDYIFFTGNMNVGKIVMQNAAKNLTPLTLELGGKNPCILHDCKNIQNVAKKITWGKFLNAGQTCVAPDILLVKDDLVKDLIVCIKKNIQDSYAPNTDINDINIHNIILESIDYGKVISINHFKRIVSLLDDIKQKISESSIIFGGVLDYNELKLSPTLINLGSIDNITMQMKENGINLHSSVDKIRELDSKNLLTLRIMQEEIFGPILPIVSYKSIESCLYFIRLFNSPLALYLFSDNKEIQEYIMQNITFGGGCINDCVLHVANNSLPFGGVGNSGMGIYHGNFSIETFSRKKGVYIATTLFDFPFRYPPFNKKILGLDRLKILRWLFK